jgi:DNA-binding GntR family transcriptional regulator
MGEIDTRSLVEKVYDYLLEQIISGAIQYGDTINVKALADRLDVSTMPVREAIKQLAFEQIVEIRPRSNCQVKVPTEKTIAETYELRELLELYALRKLIGNLNPERLEPLRDIVRKMKLVNDEKDPAAKGRAAVILDRMFHEELCRLADSEVLCHHYRQLILHVNMKLIHSWTYSKLEKRYYENHAEFLRCLEEEPERAEEVLERHFADTKAALFGNKTVTEESPIA